jgi:hypothetical protein
MKKSMFVCLALLLLTACMQDTQPGSRPNDKPPQGSLELTSLATLGGLQQLTFFNVATMNLPGMRAVLPITGTPPEALRSIDYAPDGTLYGLGVLQAGDTTRSALYTIDPLSGAATEVVQFELPFEPDDIRFVPGPNARQVRITEFRQQVVRPYTALVHVTKGAVSQVAQINAGQSLGIRPAITAFDYTDSEFLAVLGDGLTGYVQQLARTPIGQEVTLGSFVRTPPNRFFISSFVADGTVGYGTLTGDTDPTEAPIFVKVNINPSSPNVGASTEIATFPVSQLSIAQTPDSVVADRQER